MGLLPFWYPFLKQDNYTQWYSKRLHGLPAKVTLLLNYLDEKYDYGLIRSTPDQTRKEVTTKLMPDLAFDLNVIRVYLRLEA